MVLESELLNGFNQGCTRSLSQIFERFNVPLFYMAQRMIDNKHEAQDIVMSSFSKLWVRRTKFENIEKIKAFLCITTKNACYDYLKVTKNRKLREGEFQHRSTIINESYELNREVINLIIKIVRELIEDLPVRYKRAIELSYINRLTNKQIADRLGLSVQTVKNQKSLALKMLGRNLITYMESRL